MSIKKKLGLYCIVAILVVIICYLFIYVFDFEKNRTTDTTLPEIDKTLIEKLYNYIPTSNDFGMSSMYTTYYTTYKNLNYEMMENMIYDYILKYETNRLEIITLDELNIPNKNATDALYKLNSNDILEILPIIFGSNATLKLSSFNVSSKTTATLVDDYFYIYNHESDIDSDYIIFKNKVRYQITNNNKTIKIYDYYLKCEITTGNCYNDEKATILNKNIHYNKDSFNIDDYSNYLKEYEHVFEYENGYYYWVSSQGV